MVYSFNEAELLRDPRLRRERRLVLDILKAALEAVGPEKLIYEHVRREDDKLIVAGRVHDLSSYRRVFVIGAGKASAALAQALERVLGNRISAGIINTKYNYTAETKIIKQNEAGHPLPDANGLRGTEQIIALLEEAGERDLVICLLSGGGSALLPAPAPGISLADKIRVTDLLLRAGATITELNAVRKHLSVLKGGQLARLAAPAELITIILSDVIGDPLETIASGPTAPDPTTFADAQRVLQHYGLWDRVPGAVREHITRGVAGEVPETPKPGDPVFARVYNFIIGNNRIAVEAALRKTSELQLHGLLLSTFIEGEAREVGKILAALAKEIAASGQPVAPPGVVVAGGETTVTVRGAGRGGRNQELALSAAIGIASMKNVVIASLATDGTDGPTDAAGGLVDGYTLERARELGLDPREYLQDNDSYNFLRQTGDLLISGPTNTNVNDLLLVAVF